MSRIVYSSDAPPARKGWAAFDSAISWALEALGRPATFDEIAGLLPAGIHYPLILGSLRSIGEWAEGGWRLKAAPIVNLPSRTLTDTTRKAA